MKCLITPDVTAGGGLDLGGGFRGNFGVGSFIELAAHHMVNLGDRLGWSGEKAQFVVVGGVGGLLGGCVRWLKIRVADSFRMNCASS